MPSGRVVVGELREAVESSATRAFELPDEDPNDDEDGREASGRVARDDGGRLRVSSPSLLVVAFADAPAVGDARPSRGSAGGVVVELPSSAIRAIDRDPIVSRLFMGVGDAAPPPNTMLLRSGAVVNELKLSRFGRCAVDPEGEETLSFVEGDAMASPEGTLLLCSCRTPDEPSLPSSSLSSRILEMLVDACSGAI